MNILNTLKWDRPDSLRRASRAYQRIAATIESDITIPPSPVQQHVDAVIDDLVHGRLNPIQRGMLKRAMEDSAVSDLARGRK